MNVREGLMAYQRKTSLQRKKTHQLRRHKRNPKLQLIIFLIALGFAIYYYYQEQNQDPVDTYIPSYSSEQNEDGFYYYNLVGESDYYYDANQLIGQSLLLELRDIINQDLTRKTYDEARYLLESIDLALDQTDKLYGIYNSTLIDATWDGGDTWNREHVWPNSRLGMDRVDGHERNQATDLHNLRASTVGINSTKSDRVFTDGSGIADDMPDGGFYPGDEHRGDVARIVFYMAVMYDYLVLSDDLIELLDESNHYTLDGTKMGKLSLLLKWHKEDPVDAFEVARNEKIYEIQGNRNPFIDQPEYVHLIWENKTINDLLKPEEVRIDDLIMLNQRPFGDMLYF